VIAWLESLPTLAAGILIVGGFIASTLVPGYLVAIFTSKDVREAHNDRAGFILAVIGVVYAVLLAFVAIGTWERFNEARARSYEEAESLATVYRDTASFPHPERLQKMLEAYTRSVIDREWPRMRIGERAESSNALLEAVDRSVRELPVRSMSEQDVHAQMLSAIDTALADRETRLSIDFVGINGIMWAVLIAGAYITVAFTYLFGFERTLMQQLMIGGLSLTIGLVLFLVVGLDYPFRGSIAVGPDAFRALLESWQINPR
jgi:Na+/melibiose symporter-like transporter